MPARIVLHLDMDAFFASVETLDHPELRGQPVIVGGGISRGVVSACSYEARSYGVHSAMPMAQALRACPQAVVLPVRMARYHAVSERIMDLLGAWTPLIEQVSVDEAYLDLTHWLPQGITADACARKIQGDVFDATGLTCSLGVAGGKAIAKIASDLRKPNGIVVVPPGEEEAFLAPLVIEKLRGVGAATERRLHELGVQTIGDLLRVPESLLARKFGVAGRELVRLAAGRDDSPVVPERQAKSIGRETTFPVDITGRAYLERVLLELTESVAESLRRHSLLARGVTLKVRFDDFTTLTRSMMLTEPADVTALLYAQVVNLLAALHARRPVRLIGLSAGPLLPATDRQLSLFGEKASEKERKIDSALDAVRRRFGADAIKRAGLAGQDAEE